MIGNKLYNLIKDLSKQQQNNLLLKCRNSNDKRLILFKNYLANHENTLDNLNVEFSLDGNHIVKKYWLESLVLDVFPFKYNDLKNKFNFNNIKTHDEIVTNNDVCVWKRLDLSKEFVLI